MWYAQLALPGTAWHTEHPQGQVLHFPPSGAAGTHSGVKGQQKVVTCSLGFVPIYLAPQKMASYEVKIS